MKEKRPVLGVDRASEIDQLGGEVNFNNSQIDDPSQGRSASRASRYPEVTRNGFAGRDRCYPEIKTSWYIDEFDTCVEFLKKCEKTRTANIGSYWLKHRAEDWGASVGLCYYVPNGALIAAAIALGFVVRPMRPPSPNAYIGISKKSLRPLMRNRRGVGHDS